MKNLKNFVDENRKSELLRMNVAFQERAGEQGANLRIGESYFFTDETQTDAELYQAVEVSDGLVVALESFGAKMEPSLEELDNRFYKEDNCDDMEIRIVSPDVTYKATVGIGNLSKLTALWMNTNEWEEVQA